MRRFLEFPAKRTERVQNSVPTKGGSLKNKLQRKCSSIPRRHRPSAPARHVGQVAWRAVAVALALGCIHADAGVQIKFDPKYDTSGFFKFNATSGISAQDAQNHLNVLQGAADQMTARLTDILVAIPLPPNANDGWTATFANPRNEAVTETINNFTVDFDTIYVFVGGRSFGGGSEKGRADTGFSS